MLHIDEINLASDPAALRCANGTFIAVVSKEEYVAPALCLHRMMTEVSSACPFHLVVDDRDNTANGIGAESLERLRREYGERRLISLSSIISLTAQQKSLHGRRLLHGGAEAYRASAARLMLWALPPERFPLLAYLDLDLIIFRNVDVLLQTQLPFAGFAAVGDCQVYTAGRVIKKGAKGVLPVFNGGVLVFRPSLAALTNLATTSRWMAYPWNGFRPREESKPLPGGELPWYDICAPAGCRSKACSPADKMFPNVSSPLRACRERYKGKILHSRLIKACEPKYSDQSVMNIVFRSTWKALPHTYNTRVPSLGIKGGLANTSIGHFSGEPKPWSMFGANETGHEYEEDGRTSRNRHSRRVNGTSGCTLHGASCRMQAARHWWATCEDVARPSRHGR